MPAHDICQPEIIRALQKDGWNTTGKPARFYAAADMPILIDLEAFKANTHIYVEVKCFPRANRSQELHIAFGQYIIYREVLAVTRPNTILYLAIPHDNSDLSTLIFQAAIRNNRVKLKLIVVDLQHEEIVRWNK